MPILRDLRISSKFAYSFGAVCLLCALLGAASLTGLFRVSATVRDIAVNTMPSIRALGDIRLFRGDHPPHRCAVAAVRFQRLHGAPGDQAQEVPYRLQ